MSVDTSTTQPNEDSVSAVTPEPRKTSRALSGSSQVWSALWPKALAILIVIAIWQVLYWTGWKPPYALPSPATVWAELLEMVTGDRIWRAFATTMQRAFVGFSLALLIGTVIGLSVSRVSVLRRAVGSIITGLQTMPSIAWFPLAILLFGLNERAIMFVVILGAAPSIANGLISGVDHVPPAYTRLGRVLGARGLGMYRFIIMPAALPAYVSGLNQGWAFSWRSLMAGELLVVIPGQVALGSELEFARQLSDAPRLLGTMIIILLIGMVVDAVFSKLSRDIRRRRGLAVD